MRQVLLLLGAFLFATSAYGCMCVVLVPKQAFKSADTVVVGEVVDYNGTVATIRVLEWFKGSKEKTLHMSNYGGSCGYGYALSEGSTHLLFGYKSEAGSLSVSSCGGTAAISEAGCHLRYFRSRAWWWRTRLGSGRLLSNLNISWNPCPTATRGG